MDEKELKRNLLIVEEDANSQKMSIPNIRPATQTQRFTTDNMFRPRKSTFAELKLNKKIEKQQEQIDKHKDTYRAKMTKYQKLERQWKNLAFVLLPTVTVVNIYL